MQIVMKHLKTVIDVKVFLKDFFTSWDMLSLGYEHIINSQFEKQSHRMYCVANSIFQNGWHLLVKFLNSWEKQTLPS